MPEKIIYLIRHAEPEYPAGERICLGCHVDVPLSRQGRRQAEQLRDAFSDIALEAAFTSPLLRARETAQVLGRGVLPVEVVPALRELDGGVWDGLPFSEIYARWPEHFHGSCRSEPPPGGESDQAGWVRGLDALCGIAGRIDRCAAVVAHSGLNRLLLCGLMGQPLQLKKRVPQSYACVSILDWQDGHFTVREAGIPLEVWAQRAART